MTSSGGPPRGGPEHESQRSSEAGFNLPTLDFSTFVLGIIGTAYVHLGDAPSPEGMPEKSLALARQDIDLLGLLQEKTKGNLTGEEERLLNHALYNLRMRFIEVSKGS